MQRLWFIKFINNLIMKLMCGVKIRLKSRCKVILVTLDEYLNIQFKIEKGLV